ncbi:hypothetical protein NGA_0350300 [Nannochloropsis gaditana CCMP526]|nr:hypothetical protein NGA_0350300 [Nannochloropsis gaditana CCMP526]EKU21293.1 hypothetical protein NGA_0350300 [Nannochloropsis gaditana CCMP526]|eukprot:XP_005855070.1 hypothetical protein NGA_0350300 [Nannochloropsis gaditana CCMP526]
MENSGIERGKETGHRWFF